MRSRMAWRRGDRHLHEATSEILADGERLSRRCRSAPAASEKSGMSVDRTDTACDQATGVKNCREVGVRRRALLDNSTTFAHAERGTFRSAARAEGPSSNYVAGTAARPWFFSTA